ncbi:MAG: hypothetical protein RPU63_14155 [Candidatus Sedimenticola sp. (ex Thyasira tokunagai)]
MSSIDSIANPLIDPAISRSLQPVRPVVQTGNTPEQAPNKKPPPVTATKDMLAGLQVSAELLQKKHPMAEGNSARSRHAIGAYRALGNSEERERVSTLLGIDEYA